MWPGGVGTTVLLVAARLRALLVVALVLGAPLAAAASVEGDLRFPAGVNLRGTVDVAAARGALDLSRANGVEITTARLDGWLVTHAWELLGQPPAEAYRGADPPRNDTIAFPAGRITRVTCAEDCRILLFSDGAGSVGVEGAASGPLRALAEERAFAAHARGPGIQDTFWFPAPPGWLHVATSADETALWLAGSAVRAAGELSLFVANATFVIESAEGETTVDTRTTSSALAGPASVVPGRRIETRFALLRLGDTALTLGPGGAVSLLAPEATLGLDGELAASAAEGELTVEGTRRTLAGESLRIDGAVTGQARALALGPVAPLAVTAPHATIGGDAREVAIDGVVVADATVSRAAAIAGLTLGAFLLGALAIVKLVGLSPLYTRIERGAVLQNDNRRVVYDAIRAAPGMNVADVVRQTSLVEVVVRHHLRMLEEHQMVVMRPAGRLRTYFALDGQVDPQLAQVYAALKDGSRRRVATALVDAAVAATQKDLADSTGISQRLVSYHLARLEKEGLVISNGSTPRRYEPTERLRMFLGVTGAQPVAA